MNRRDLFSFLAVAPVGVAATVSELSKPEQPTEIKLPINAKPGDIVMVVNTGSGFVRITG